MGRRQQHKKKFLAANPICCFCGGGTASAEVDHVPSRTLFKGRAWPEGFEFPACRRCNQATRYDEQIVSMLSRIYPDATTEEEKAETREAIRAVATNHPEVLLEMQATPEQDRDAVLKYGLEPRRMRDGKLPILSVRGPCVNAAIANFARKLFCALYYMHSSRIVPSAGGIAFRWYTNVQIDADEIPRDLAPLLSHFPVLQRARTGLDDQFFYRWNVAEEKSMGAFLAFFRRSFAILAFVSDDAKAFPSEEGMQVIRPYNHGEASNGT